MASLYGTRDASANWQGEVGRCLKEWGFIARRYNPCMFYHPGRGVMCLVHGDDFVCVGGSSDLEWVKEKLKKRLEIKTSTVGTDEKRGEVKEARILNRIIRVEVIPVGSMQRTNGMQTSSFKRREPKR